MEDKREGQRKAKRCAACRNQRRERTSPSCGRKAISPTTLLMSLACKSWDLIVIGGLEQASLTHAIFLSIAKAKAHWRAILTCYLKSWMQKNKDKWSLNCLLWKRRTHSLMKWSISCPGVPCTSMVIRIKWRPSWSPLYLKILMMVLSFTTTPMVN
jgi:hypothetical protein